MFNAEAQKENVIQWIKDWFSRNGPDCNAIIGISGGKDSTVAAALCAEALGKERVYGILMPCGQQADICDSFAVCEHLGIHCIHANIEAAVDRVYDALMSEFGRYSRQTEINVPPRIRMTMLYAFSQTLNGRVVNTCNLSEDYVGYSTKYGDTAGDFAPLKCFTSDEVIEIGRVLGIPERLLTKAPADGLCGKTDEDNLGFTYAVLNRYIREGLIDDMAAKKKIDKLHQKNRFKELPMERFTMNDKGDFYG